MLALLSATVELCLSQRMGRKETALHFHWTPFAAGALQVQLVPVRRSCCPLVSNASARLMTAGNNEPLLRDEFGGGIVVERERDRGNGFQN